MNLNKLLNVFIKKLGEQFFDENSKVFELRV